METINFELDRFDSCVRINNGYRFSVGIVVGEFRCSISKTAKDGVTCEFFESKSYPTLTGASLWLNKINRELNEKPNQAIRSNDQ